MAPQVGLEPTTDRLTADCSTTELLRNNNYSFKLVHVVQDKFHYNKNKLFFKTFFKSLFCSRQQLLYNIMSFAYLSTHFHKLYIDCAKRGQHMRNKYMIIAHYLLRAFPAPSRLYLNNLSLRIRLPCNGRTCCYYTRY